jgi:hypothetical protein
MDADDSLDCECRIPAGDSLRLGYYRYSERTAVRVTDNAGWSARITDFGGRRDSSSGAVLLRVDRDDLRPPPRAQSRRIRPAQKAEGRPRNPLESFLPVR